jgi:hypothetical protein
MSHFLYLLPLKLISSSLFEALEEAVPYDACLLF